MNETNGPGAVVPVGWTSGWKAEVAAGWVAWHSKQSIFTAAKLWQLTQKLVPLAATLWVVWLA